MSAQAEMMAGLDTRVPLIADMDTGYGGAANIHRAVKAYVRAGVAGFHIEDQVQQKRCGHLANKSIVPLSVFAMRIRAAVAARRAARSDIVVIARTDSLASHGYDEALARLVAARDEGADAGFLEGVDSEETMSRVVKDLAPWPVVLNMIEAGRTPTVSVGRAKEIGYRCVIWSFAGLVPALLALRQAYTSLKETGLIEGKKLSPKEIFELCGLQEWMRVENEAGGAVFTNGV
jgi:methylisocitrate lyase